MTFEIFSSGMVKKQKEIIKEAEIFLLCVDKKLSVFDEITASVNIVQSIILGKPIILLAETGTELPKGISAIASHIGYFDSNTEDLGSEIERCSKRLYDEFKKLQVFK